MISNHFKLTLRNFWKNKVITLIDLACLSIGMACCMLILIYVKDELSYNKFNTNYNSTYRIDWTSNRDGKFSRYAITPVPLGKMAALEIPQIESLARIYQRSGGMEIRGAETQATNDKKFQEQNVLFADSSLFSIFSIRFIKGNPEKSLTGINTVVITDEMAQKYFGNEDAIGKFLFYDAKTLLQVNGVVQKLPANSDLQFDFLISFQTLFSVENPEIADFIKNDWTYNPVLTYCTLKKEASITVVEKALNAVLRKHGTERNKQLNTTYLFPLNQQHLYASDIQANPSNSSFEYIYVFCGIALLILLIANVNFINLATARASTRVREIGMRKVLGATKKQLAFQYLSETLLLSFFAFLIALLLTQSGLPVLNQLTMKTFNWHHWLNATTLLLFSAIFIINGLLAGTYPAFFVTRFKTLLSLKGKSGIAGQRNFLRKTLLVTQFTISVGLIAGAFIIYRQLQYLRNKPLGFEKDYVLNVPLFGSGSSSLGYGVDGPMRQRMNTFSDKLLQHNRVKAVTAASALPGQWYIPGLVIPEGASESDNIFIPWLCVDYNFISTMKIPLLAGRDFSKSTGTDHLSAFIINEAAVKSFGWKTPENAVGKNIIRGKADDGKKGQVIGVIKDHHFNSLDQPLQPLIMDVTVARFSAFAISIQPDHVPETINFIKQNWNELFPERVFEYSFLDQDIHALYNNNENLSKVTGYFALLAIVLSCLGLFSLSSFLIVRRNREIGIRKTLGSGVVRIITLLSREFIQLVLISIVVATPIALYVTGKWLQNYHHRIEIGWWGFLAAGLIVLTLTTLTVLVLSAKAAMMNPVKCLRTE